MAPREAMASSVTKESNIAKHGLSLLLEGLGGSLAPPESAPLGPQEMRPP